MSEEEQKIARQQAFNKLFSFGPGQKKLEDQLKGMCGRAGFGDSGRSKRRKINTEKGLVEENSKSIFINRMFARQQEKRDLLECSTIPDPHQNEKSGSNSIQLLKFTDEPRAVLSHREQLKEDINCGITALKRILELKSVRVKENLTGQWEKQHRIVLAFLYYQQKNPKEKLSKIATTVAATFGRVNMLRAV